MKSNLIAFGVLFAVMGITQTSAAPTIGPQSAPEDIAAVLKKDSNLTQVPAWYKAGVTEAVLITGVSEVKGKRGVLRVICPLIKVGADAKKVTASAILAGANPSKIVDAASCQGFSKTELIAFAIQAGADPAELTASPAAGGQQPGTPSAIQIGPLSTADDVADMLERKSNLAQIPDWYKNGASAKILITGVGDVEGKDGVLRVICPLMKVGADPRLVTIAAIEAGAAPSKVVNEGSCQANKADLIAAAILAGADPTELTESPAAGGGNEGSAPTTPPPGGGSNTRPPGTPGTFGIPGTLGNNEGFPPITPPFLIIPNSPS